MILLVIYGIFCIIGFVLMGYDKWLSIRFAQKSRVKRIPEKVLLQMACLGGVGVWLGMVVFHHKTRKPRFYIGVPLLSLVGLLIMQYLFRGQ